MKPARGFTLIELLVVISIISLLSSVVLASLNAAREKARIGAARQFGSVVEHAAGDSAVAIWDYDECATNTTYDRSGNGNNGILNSAASWSTDTPNGTGCSIYFNGTNGMSYAGGSASVPAYQFGSGSVTIAGWINPAAGVTNGGYNSVFSSWGSPARLGIGIGNGTVVSYMVKDSLSNEVSGFTTTSIPLDKWSFLVMAVDREAGRLNVYVDGKPTNISNTSIASITGSLSLSAAAQTAASWGGTGAYLNGKVDGVRVYSKALTALEVGRLYAEGIGKRALAYSVE